MSDNDILNIECDDMGLLNLKQKLKRKQKR
jgi:hypothetical protein